MSLISQLQWMQAVRTRLMQEKDIPGISAIEKETLSPWMPEALLKELNLNRGIQLVAETVDAEIIGWCGCMVVAPEAELMKISIEPEWRRCGVAGLLFETLLKELRKREITALFLEVRSTNRAAVNFYKKNGFQKIGQRVAYYNKPLDDAIVFTKDLN